MAVSCSRFFYCSVCFVKPVILNKLKGLAKESPGSLRIDNSRGRAQYYLYQPGSEKSVTYISKKNTDLIKELAQRQYDREVVKAAGQEKRVIKWIREHYPEKTPESIYDALSPARQALVTPIVETLNPRTGKPKINVNLIRKMIGKYCL